MASFLHSQQYDFLTVHVVHLPPNPLLPRQFIGVFLLKKNEIYVFLPEFVHVAGELL
jgi:hypothetical protein